MTFCLASFASSTGLEEMCLYNSYIWRKKKKLLLEKESFAEAVLFKVLVSYELLFSFGYGFSMLNVPGFSGVQLAKFS